MAVKISELIEWLKTLEKDDIVWIEDSGLTLETKDGAYLEVGGKVEFYDEDENPEEFWKK
jgi:hypothetical protein